MSSYCTSPSLDLRHSFLGWRDEHTQASTSAPAAASDWADELARAVQLGESHAAQKLRAQLERIAPHLRTGLLRGEPGSGKQLVARALHAMGSGAAAPFVLCPAAALAEAVASNPSTPAVISLFASAAGGTLYLEAVGELPYPLQTALVRFLAARQASRTLSEPLRNSTVRRQPLELRILAGTHRDLRTLASVGQFRPDLYARLSAVEIVAPPLRERTDDLPLLAGFVLQRLSRRTGLSAKVLSPAALIQLLQRPWRNNLREFEQVLTHAAALAEGAIIEARHMPPPPAESPAEPVPTPEPVACRPDRLDDVIQHHVLAVLTRCGGNKLRAAELLGISRSTLYRMLESCAAPAVKAPACTHQP